MNTQTTEKSNKKANYTVAQYIEQQINLCGKTQLEIAEESGFPKANVITMIKQGKTKLPKSKIGAFAKALGVDPIHLFRLVMQEYEPESWEVIQQFGFNQPVVTQNELEILEVVRQSNVQNPKIRTEEERIRLLDVINTLRPENATRD